MRQIGIVMALAATLVATGLDAAPPPRKVPYWASIAAGDALMRTGPGRNYPAKWRYRRPALPVRVVQVHESWRRVRDPDGVEGWMASVLLSAERSGIVTRRVAALRSAPDLTSRVRWRVGSGVIGRIRHCAQGWCEFKVKERSGYVETAALWGLDAGETID